MIRDLIVEIIDDPELSESAKMKIIKQLHRDQIESNARLLLQVRGLTQADLGRAIGVRRERVGQMLARPTERSMRAIAEALGVPVEWLEDPALAGKTVEELRGKKTPLICRSQDAESVEVDCGITNAPPKH